MIIDWERFAALFLICIVVGTWIQRLRRAYREDALIARALASDVEPPSLICLTGEELALYERYKTLLSAGRFASKDATNEAKEQLLWAMLDIIEPDYWIDWTIEGGKK